MALSDELLDLTAPGVRPLPKAAAQQVAPRDLAALLAELSPACRALYQLVRETVDELERVISWGLLYYPPDDHGILIGRFEALAACIRRLPARLSERIAAFSVEDRGTGEALRSDVDFYFEAVLRMVERDLGRLESALAEPGRDQPGTGDIDRLCELAADLKGKFASSIMGATAALLSQGRWPSVEAEVVLFAEKAEDGRLSSELATSLRAIVEWLGELPDRVPLPEIVARWRVGQRADQYAFSDLVVLRGQLGSLLRERARRALYSGDYHQIRWREMRLAERLDELERLHRASWAISAGAAAGLIAEHFGRFETLAQEIAALIDVNQLAAMTGSESVQRLRAHGQAERGGQDGTLAGLIAHDDLRLFCRMLLGAVERRAALAAVGPASAPAGPLSSNGARSGTAQAPAALHGARAIPAKRAAPAVKAPPSLSPAEQASLVADSRRRIANLQSPQNSNWNSFRMVRRMFERHGRVPDEMFRAAQPFVDELLIAVIPDLRRLAPYRGLSVEHVDRLEGTCRGLVTPAGQAPAVEAAVHQRLERLQRFLDALRTVLEMD